MNKLTPALEPDQLSPDTVECLGELLDAAKAGTVVGISFAVILKRGNFWVNTAGEARRRAALAYTTVGALHLKLGHKILGIESDV